VQRAQIAAKVMGTIEELPITLGQKVRAGDLLVKISAGEITARVAQVQAQLNVARRDLERERDLLTKNASTADMVRGLEDRLAMTQAMMREAEVMLGYATVRAPFDGVVARKLAHAGDLAAPGQPLLEVEGLGDFQVEAAVPDSLATKLAPGTALAIDVPAAGLSFNGTLAELSSAADANAHSVLAKISVPAGTAVRSGQFARVQLSGAPVKTLLAPAASVSTLGQMERIFVAGDGNRAVLRLVKTGVTRGDRVEILAGLDDGERVVVAPPTGLRDGQSLEVQP
jgi:RND family efflux transporter MFP subunit